MFENLFHSKSNERLRMMIEAIRTRDFSLQYSTEKLRGEEKALAMEINSVINEFRQTTLEQETQYQYFETLLNTVDSILIVTDEQYNVCWMNKSAVEGLCGFKFQKISDLASISEELAKVLQEGKAGEQRLVSFAPQGEGVKNYAVNFSNLYNKGIFYKLFYIQNIQTIVQENEAKTQQQLVRVLTHEIMNSLTPIISLADTLREQCEEGSLDSDDTLMALQAIHRRSSGLLQFVENYRQLQKISQPKLAPVSIGDLINGILKLYANPIIKTDIEAPDTTIQIDRSQMEQVIINLLKNACEACEDTGREPVITISTRLNKQKREVSISVSDNGKGILPEVMDRIFVPFFTTKTGGSGIGLSLCKQIISLHGGTISASSSEEETVFRIVMGW